MKEINEIIGAYLLAKQRNLKVALATVVHVEGSSYRKPGARMLVTEKGQITGAISGGCLEGDALRKALLAISEQKNKIVTYDTSDEDVTFGVQLGCNGIIHILFEPVNYGDQNNAIELLRKIVVADRKAAVMCTLYSLSASGYQIGATFLFTGDAVYGSSEIAEPIKHQLAKDASDALSGKTSSIRQYNLDNGTCSGLIEMILPPVSLVVAGAGNDAIPVITMAKSLGWETTLIDGRSTHANPERFPLADKISVGSPRELISTMMIDDRTAFVLMTHNYNYDKAMIELLLEKNTNYIGCLGPQKKLGRMLAEIQQTGTTIPENQIAKLYGPVGLDIGAETSEEIALSVVAEIQAVMQSKKGNSLKWKNGTIHDRFNGDYLLPSYFETGSITNNASANDGFSCSINL